MRRLDSLRTRPGASILSRPPFATLFGILDALTDKEDLPRPEDLALLEFPDDNDFCLVGIEIYRDDRLIGADRGVVWFEAGRILFNGHRTSFAIGGEDVLPRDLWNPTPHRTILSKKNRRTVPLRALGPTTFLEFVPLADGRDLAQRSFLEKLKEFSERPPQSRGPRQWPPFEP